MTEQSEKRKRIQKIRDHIYTMASYDLPLTEEQIIQCLYGEIEQWNEKLAERWKSETMEEAVYAYIEYGHFLNWIPDQREILKQWAEKPEKVDNFTNSEVSYWYSRVVGLIIISEMKRYQVW